jgi:Fur family ferric uptake transcriptional regulator
MLPTPPADLLTRLRSRRWRITPQRRAVAQALAGEHVHLSAEEVHERALAIVPEVSLATVYSTLNQLVAMGEVAEVRAPRSSVRYDPNARQQHHHLVCERCGRIRDVRPSGMDDLRLSDADRSGFRIATIEVVFRGVCPACEGRE